jgi:DtxR family Mn-dependent transcriptional regulator
MQTETETDHLELTESLEDYLEVILHVVAEKQTVRPKDIVARMGVRGASVTGALRALAKRGLIRYAPYDAISLTPEGTEIAKDVINRHEVLRRFLTQILGVEMAAADAEACRMEHAVSRLVLTRLVKLAAFLEACPRAILASIPAIVQGAPAAECKRCDRPEEWVAAQGDSTKPKP